MIMRNYISFSRTKYIYIEKNLISIPTENHNFRFNPLRWNFNFSTENEDISIRGKRNLFHFNLNFSISSRIQTLRFHTSLLRIQTTINEMWQITFRKPIKKQYTFHLKLFPQRERHLSSLTVDERNSIGEEDNWRRFDVLKCIFGKSDNDKLQEMRFFLNGVSMKSDNGDSVNSRKSTFLAFVFWGRYGSARDVIKQVYSFLFIIITLFFYGTKEMKQISYETSLHKTRPKLIFSLIFFKCYVDCQPKFRVKKKPK